MDDYKKSLKCARLLGIEADYWLQFFKVFEQEKTPDEIKDKFARTVANLSARFASEYSEDDEILTARILEMVEESLEKSLRISSQRTLEI